MPKKRGLGKGVNALFPTIEENLKEPNTGGVTKIKLIDIEPNKNQPRKNFDKESLESLAASIKENGIIQPLIVKKINDRYLIVAGERRWRASKIAGLKEVPVIVADYTDKQVMEVALVENLQREDLNPIDEAVGYKSLMDAYSLTQEQVSEKIGKSRSAIANSLRLLNLSDSVIIMLKKGEISEGHAKAILPIKDISLQIKTAKLIAEKEMSVRETEKYVKQLLNPPRRIIKPDTALADYISDLENKTSKIIGTKVRIKHKNGKGKIEIEYYSNDELERLLTILEKQ